MEFLLDGIRAVTPQQCVMYVVGALLIYLAIKKDYEPSLLLPMGFGAILVNLPNSGAAEVIAHLFELGIAGHDGGLFALDNVEREHWLKVFVFMFRREAFLPHSPKDGGAPGRHPVPSGHPRRE